MKLARLAMLLTGVGDPAWDGALCNCLWLLLLPLPCPPTDSFTRTHTNTSHYPRCRRYHTQVHVCLIPEIPEIRCSTLTREWISTLMHPHVLSPLLQVWWTCA